VPRVGAEPTQARSPSKFGERFDAFLLLWDDRQVALSSLQEFRQREPADTPNWSLLLLGDGPSPGELGIDAGAFVRQGGSLLVATDRAMSLPLGRPPSFQILSGPIRSSRPASSYQGNPACPLVTEFRREHPLLAGIERIVLNLPGVLAGGESNAWSVAYLPRTLDVRVFSRAWLVAGDLDQGRFVLSADPSPLTNEMIQEGDNSRLAENIVSWMLERRTGKGGRVVCLVNGREMSRLVDERFVTGEWEKRPPTAQILNELLRGLQEEGVPNSLAREAQTALHQWNPWFVRSTGVIALGSIMGALLAWRILGARQGRDPLLAPDPAESWTSTVDRSLASTLPRSDRLLEARQRELVQLDNFREELRRLSTRALDRWLGPGRWRDSLSPVPRDVGGWWARRRRRQQLTTIRRWALGSARERVGERKFRHWQSQIARLDSIIMGAAESAGLPSNDPRKAENAGV
jgi:hypothetical protein